MLCELHFSDDDYLMDTSTERQISIFILKEKGYQNATLRVHQLAGRKQVKLQSKSLYRVTQGLRPWVTQKKLPYTDTDKMTRYC